MKTKKIIIFSILFILMSFVHGQSSEFVTQLLNTKEATYGQVCYLVAVYNGYIDENDLDLQKAVERCHFNGLINNFEEASKIITYKDVAGLFSKAWDVDGGLMYIITKGSSRYAFNQLKVDKVIPMNVDPSFIPSGTDVLNVYTLGDLKYENVNFSAEEIQN